jgi:T5SS/PEP-CTERM-associated repeat protein
MVHSIKHIQIARRLNMFEERIFLYRAVITACLLTFIIFIAPVQAGVTVSGDVNPFDASTWNTSTYLYVGESGSGEVNITNGSEVSIYKCTVGDGSSSTGTVTVDGNGSALTLSDKLVVSFEGDGTLNILNGGRVSNTIGMVGMEGTGLATVDGIGSTWALSEYLYVSGDDGIGTLYITNGGLVSVLFDVYLSDDHFVDMSTGGMLALGGQADSLEAFEELLGLTYGDNSGRVRYWNGSGWDDIANATEGEDYTLNYISSTGGELDGYTVLTVGIPEPGTVLLLGVGGLVLRRRR